MSVFLYADTHIGIQLAHKHTPHQCVRITFLIKSQWNFSVYAHHRPNLKFQIENGRVSKLMRIMSAFHSTNDPLTQQNEKKKSPRNKFEDFFFGCWNCHSTIAKHLHEQWLTRSPFFLMRNGARINRLYGLICLVRSLSRKNAMVSVLFCFPHSPFNP